MGNYYKRDGTPYPEGTEGLIQWGRDMEDPKKKIVKQEMVNGYWVSTVWLGLDHAFVQGDRIQIFETMVFDRRKNKKNYSELDCERYATEEEALKGHKKIVRKYKKLIIHKK